MKQKKRKEVSEIREEKSKQTLSKLNRIKDIEEIFPLIRSFFADFFMIRKQETFDELGEMIESKRGIEDSTKLEIKKLLKKLTLIEYGNKQESLDILKEEIKKAINNLENEKNPVDKKRKKSRFEKLKFFIKELKKKKQIKTYERQIRKLIKKNSLDEAKEKYNDLYELYEELSEKKKAKIYEKVIETYNSLNKAIKTDLISSNKEKIEDAKKKDKLKEPKIKKSSIKKIKSKTINKDEKSKKNSEQIVKSESKSNINSVEKEKKKKKELAQSDSVNKEQAETKTDSKKEDKTIKVSGLKVSDYTSSK